jgi:hypothetical protein
MIETIHHGIIPYLPFTAHSALFVAALRVTASTKKQAENT